MAEHQGEAPITRLISLQTTSLGALTLGAFLLMKCYAVAHYSLTTAAALLTASPLSVLLGSIMLYMYSFLPLLGLAALFTVVQILIADHSGKAILLATAFASVGVTAVALSPAYYLLLAGGPPVAFLLICWIIWRVADRRRRGREATSLRERVMAPLAWLTPLEWIAGYFIVYAATVVAVTLDTMWVPTEIVSLQVDGDTKYVVGNVLSDDGRWVTVLRSQDHGLSRIPAGQVTARTLCHMRGAQPQHRGPVIDTLLHHQHPSPNHQCIAVLKDMPMRVTRTQIYPGSLPTSMQDQLP